MNDDNERNDMSNTLHDELGKEVLRLGWDLNIDWYTFSRFAQLVVARGLPHVGSTSWACEKDTLEGLFDRTVATQRAPGTRAALITLDDVVGGGCIALVWLSYGTISLRVAGRTVDDLATARAWIRER